MDAQGDRVDFEDRGTRGVTYQNPFAHGTGPLESVLLEYAHPPTGPAAVTRVDTHQASTPPLLGQANFFLQT